MSTQEQTNANRQNAQSSTGPKTPEGKAISSQNAIKNGFFAKNDVISGEDLAAYEEHRQDFYDEYVPLTPTECVLTQRIASLSWRLMRADRLQTTTINTLVAAQHKATPPPVNQKFDINRMMKTLHEKYENPELDISDASIILAGLARFKYEPISTDPAVDAAMNAALSDPADNHLCDAEIELGTVIYNDFHGSAVIERLQGYEQKIETSLFKTIRQIQQIQERRIKQDAAQNKRDWEYLRQEGEERKRRREEEYQQRIHDACCAEEEHRRKSNPSTGTACRAPNPENEPNSELTSTTETTYNTCRQEKARTKESNQTNLTNPDDHPGRRTNKQT